MSAGANNNRGNERLRRLSIQLVGANCRPAMGTVQSALATVPTREQLRERVVTVGHSAAVALPSPSETAAPGLHGLSAVERYYFETQGFVVVPDIIPKELLAKLNAVSCSVASLVRFSATHACVQWLSARAHMVGCGCVRGPHLAYDGKAQRRCRCSSRRVWPGGYWIIHALATATLSAIPRLDDAATDGSHNA